MEKYDPERMELSTRDRVAMANYTEIMAGRGTENGGIYLDISHRDKDFIIEKLPRMYRQFLDTLMLDISKSPMEVAPTAHYSMGGVVVHPDDHWTGIQGLFAAGEVTGGLHGANRLGGNSLAEILIFGKRAGAAAAKWSDEIQIHRRSKAVIQKAHDKINSFIKNGSQVVRPLQRDLRNIMWQHCGVLRNEKLMQEGLEKIEDLKAAMQHIDVRPDSEGFQDLMIAFDLEASIYSAEATILPALERKESRGAHQRSDYEATSDEQLVNYYSKLDSDDKIVLEKRAVEQMSKELQAVINNTQQIEDFEGMLLE